MRNDELRVQSPKASKATCDACGEYGARPRYGLMLCDECEED